MTNGYTTVVRIRDPQRGIRALCVQPDLALRLTDLDCSASSRVLSSRDAGAATLGPVGVEVRSRIADGGGLPRGFLGLRHAGGPGRERRAQQVLDLNGSHPGASDLGHIVRIAGAIQVRLEVDEEFTNAH